VALSQKVFHTGLNLPQKSDAKNYSEGYPPKEKMLRNQDSDLPTFLGDLSQNEKLSEIMPPVPHQIFE
jgi:hypothetical protein